MNLIERSPEASKFSKNREQWLEQNVAQQFSRGHPDTGCDPYARWQRRLLEAAAADRTRAPTQAPGRRPATGTNADGLYDDSVCGSKSSHSSDAFRLKITTKTFPMWCLMLSILISAVAHRR